MAEAITRNQPKQFFLIGPICRAIKWRAAAVIAWAFSNMDHQKTIQEQFTQQAVVFSNAPSMKDADAIRLLIETAQAKSHHHSLDVACGPGLVALGFAPAVRSAVGLDATRAMLDRAGELQRAQGIQNAEWVLGEAYSLPFPDASFDIVTCRFAFHHMLQPETALREMLRVARPGGRILVCDAVASSNVAKANAFNEFERMRDPSTVRFLTAVELRQCFVEAQLAIDVEHSYRVPTELEGLLSASFPDPANLPNLRAVALSSVDGDSIGMNSRLKGERLLLDYSALVLSALKPE